VTTKVGIAAEEFCGLAQYTAAEGVGHPST
jgi:hypothetical protein